MAHLAGGPRQTLCGCYCYLHPIGDAYRHARIAHGINDAAQLSSNRSSTASRPRSLLQIFFREGIGWNIRPGSARPSFEDATGYVSGARVTGRDISRQLGLPYIWADGIDMARSRVADHGSEVVEGSSFSSWGGTSWLTMRAPRAPLPDGLRSPGYPTVVTSCGVLFASHS